MSGGGARLGGRGDREVFEDRFETLADGRRRHHPDLAGHLRREVRLSQDLEGLVVERVEDLDEMALSGQLQPYRLRGVLPGNDGTVREVSGHHGGHELLAVEELDARL